MLTMRQSRIGYHLTGGGGGEGTGRRKGSGEGELRVAGGYWPDQMCTLFCCSQRQAKSEASRRF